MMLDFPKILFFCELAECLNFTEAAERLYTTQSSLSKAIARLEDTLDCKLFVRNNRSVELTPAGEYLYKYFKKQVEDMHEAVELARKYNNGILGTLSIAACANDFFLPRVQDLINGFARQNPMVKINFHSPNMQDAKNKIVTNQFDILVTKEEEVELLSSCDWLNIIPVRTVAYINKQHPILKGKDYIEFTDLKSCQFVTTSPLVSNRIHNNLYTVCQRYGFVPKNVKYTKHIAEMHMEVIVNGCVGILGEHECAHLSDVKLIHIDGIPVKSTVFAWNRINDSPMLMRFLDYCNTTCCKNDQFI